MKKAIVPILAILIALAAYGLYRKTHPARAKNLLLITVDALRADNLGAYGYPLDQKNLTNFSRSALVFDNAFTTMPTTQPALSSIFTSMYPMSHTVRKNGMQLPADALTLAEILKQKGWKTAAFVSAFPLTRRFKLNQGFEEYWDDIAENGAKLRPKLELKADRMTQKLLNWMNKDKSDSNEFVWIHYFDPHAPYTPPAKFSSVKSPRPNASPELNAYDGEIQFLDEQLGVLFEGLKKTGRLDDTLIIFVSDHGEGFKEHGYSGHGWFLYDEVIRVALMMHGPGIEPGRSPVLIQHVDLAPGILDYFGIPSPGTFEGKSWWKVLKGEAPARLGVWVERRLPPISTVPDPELAEKQEQAAVEEKWTYRTATAKFIWSSDGNHEFYDLAHDPLEKNNLYTPSNSQAAALEKEGLMLREKTLKAALNPSRDLQKQDQESRDALKALGYVN